MCVHRCAFLPLVLWQLAWSIFVLTVIVATVFTRTASSPSVIGHYCILIQGRSGKCLQPYGKKGTAECLDLTRKHTDFDRAVIVEPGQELGGVPVGVRCLPVPIGPDHLRSVPAKQEEDRDLNILMSGFVICNKHVCIEISQ